MNPTISMCCEQNRVSFFLEKLNKVAKKEEKISRCRMGRRKKEATVSWEEKKVDEIRFN